MDNIQGKEEELKNWNKPKLFILPISKTAGGINPAPSETPFDQVNSEAS